MESNGPDVKVRGTPQQILDKYMALARDAWSSGDRIVAESYYQHADHYYRILNAEGGGGPHNGYGRGDRGPGPGPTPGNPEVHQGHPEDEAPGEGMPGSTGVGPEPVTP